MNNLAKIKKTFQKIITDNAEIEIPAFLGNISGVVDAGNGNVWVVVQGVGLELIVKNNKVPLKKRWPVVIGKDKHDGTLRVLKERNSFFEPDVIDIVDHSPTQEWPARDTLWVHGEQILPLLPMPNGGMTIKLFGGRYTISSQVHFVNTQDIDLSAEIPASGAEWVNVEIDSSGVIDFNHGANKAARELLLDEDIPATATNKCLLFSVKMYLGLIDFVQTETSSDIFDPRFVGRSQPALAWGDITGTLADQADLLSALNAKISANTPIVAATKTKITYDADGLVTNGEDATTADIVDSTDKRYVTDDDLTVLENTSGINTGDQVIPGEFPVGWLQMSVVNTNPATFLGYGTWTAFGAGRVLVGYDAGQAEFDTVEETGGAKTVTLSTAQMPVHTHVQNSHNHTQDAHSHTQNAHNHTQDAHNHTQNAHNHYLWAGRKYVTGLTSSGGTGSAPSSSGSFFDLYTGDTTPTNNATTATNQAATATNQNATATNQAATATNQNAGSGAAHDNLQPYIVVYFWKRTA